MTKKVLTPEQKAFVEKVNAELEADKKAEITHAEITVWMGRARKQTFETLPAFLKEVHDLIPNSYGNICHKMGIASVAAMSAFDHSDQGGITEFQASCAMWDSVCGWTGDYGPQMLVKFEDMLYPQYDTKFTSISKETFKWLQSEARKKLSGSEGRMHPNVREHMESIIMGKVPFGYTVRD